MVMVLSIAGGLVPAEVSKGMGGMPRSLLAVPCGFVSRWLSWSSCTRPQHPHRYHHPHPHYPHVKHDVWSALSRVCGGGGPLPHTHTRARGFHTCSTHFPPISLSPSPPTSTCRFLRSLKARASESRSFSRRSFSSLAAVVATGADGSVVDEADDIEVDEPWLSGIFNECVSSDRDRTEGSAHRRSLRVMERSEWEACAKTHRQRALGLLGGSTTHDSTNPVYNFLFEYYHFKPRDLLAWSPGAGPVVLLDAEPEHLQGGDRALLAKRGVQVVVDRPTGVVRGLMYLPRPGARGIGSDKHVNGLRFAREVLRASIERPPLLFCHGVHEWAMLYRPEGAREPPRHQQLPLRIAQQTINAYVESRPIHCTHYDAFRFFMPEARPLNIHHQKLSERHGQIATEQPGCLHANMDLFKWAVKLGPYASSDLVTRALDVAVQARVLDMRASPYDLSPLAQNPNFGFDTSPVCVETPEGRRQYAELQEQLMHRATPVRRDVLEAYEDFFAAFDRLQERKEMPT